MGLILSLQARPKPEGIPSPTRDICIKKRRCDTRLQHIQSVLQIPVQVPATETCFMSIDEILIFLKSQNSYNHRRRAQNFSMSQSLRKYEGIYRGGELGIFLSPYRGP